MSTEDTTTTAAAGPVERPVRLDPERAWLVEWRFNGTQWLYLTGGSFNFTADPNRALRLARRADAEAAMQWAIEFDRRRGLRPTGELLVTEHEWPNVEVTGFDGLPAKSG